MRGYPIVLTGLAGRRCVVIGGGAVAARKAAGLLEAGARPVVISPELGPELEALAAAGQVVAVRRRFQPDDLDGAHLAIAATDDPATNAAVFEEAQRRGILVNVVDAPALCTFSVPAVIRRGALAVAISTGGASPALARRLREALERAIDPACGDLLAILAELRPVVQDQIAPSQRRLLWERLLDGELLACLRAEGLEAGRTRARRIIDESVHQPHDDGSPERLGGPCRLSW